MTRQSFRQAARKELAAAEELLLADQGPKALRAIHRLITDMDDMIVACAQVRYDAIRQLRDDFGWSFGEIGTEADGLTRERVRQIYLAPRPSGRPHQQRERMRMSVT